ncbi:RNA polymerase sigma factor [Rhizobium sp. TH2]|uniref:RNA polymerase sigma factor n=1 Tax=Rhizobium sp. TH2 TaxID=2775403 RepID=UPI002157E94F|nr:RNA polymerase sigma factor [Rhizobium sp. TH2]UVC09978.1 RNA polymerase sigma factor [Rhizobium sp. TH2]
MTAAKARPPADLVVAAQAGDQRAISELLVICQPDIRRYARQTCKSQDIDDAVQDAMIVLYRQVGTLRVAAALLSWLFAVVKRECLRQVRLAARFAGSSTGAEADPDISRADHELRLDIDAALISLPEHYRRIIILRDIEELTIGEIAARLSITEQAAKARLHRARMLVREYLGPET